MEWFLDSILGESPDPDLLEPEALARIISHAPMAIAVLEGLELRYALVNPAYRALFGPEEMFVGRTLREVLPEIAHGGVERALRDVLETARPQKIRDFEAAAGGREHATYWTADALPLRRSPGKPGAVLVFVSEITERKRTEAALRESEARFRVMADGLPLMVWVHDANGAQQFVNRSFCEFFGITLEEMHGDRWQLLMHSDDAAVYRDAFLACTRERRPFHAEVRVRRADGEWRWIESWARPRISPAGEFLGFVGASADVTARKEAEQTVRESEAKLAAIIKSLPVGIGVIDASGRILSLNPVGLRIHGVGSLDEMPVLPEDYRTQFELYDSDGRPVPVEASPLARAARGEFVSNQEVRLCRPDREERFVSYSVVPTCGGPDGTALIFFLMHDITARKQAQETLRRTIAQSRAIFNQMTEGLVVFDPQGNLLDMNPAALAIHGFETVDKLRRHLNALADTFELFDLEGRPLPTGAWPIGRVLRGETFKSYEVRVRRPDTNKAWIGSYGGAPVYGPQGELLLAIVTLRDVTAQHEAEQALAQAKQQLETALTATEMGVWHWDIQNNRMHGDRNMLKLSGLEHTDQALSLEIFVDRIHALDRDRVLAAVEHAVTTRSFYEEEYRVVYPDGQVRWIHVRGRVEADKQGRAAAFPGVAVDVTARKRAEEALREADRRKDEFLATLAHELRNPLAPIRSGIEVLRLSGSHPSADERTLEMMERQMEHMVRLVDDLLDVSRISRGKVSLRRQKIDLADAIRSAIETSVAAPPGHRQISVDLPAEPLMVDADPVRIVQIVANLLNNAVKYTEDDGEIWISAAREGGQARCSVRDDGIGIAPQILEEVFSLFAQADAARAGGLGIGLTLVRSLVELHGGSVEAHSEGVGGGSEFIVRLPLAADRQVDSVHHQQHQKKGSTTLMDRRVLIVDDNKDVAESLAMLLQILGAEVRTVHDGQSALALLDEFQPNTVFLDIGMPGMDGYEVGRRVRARDPAGNILLVAVTGWGQEEDRQRVKHAGFDYHLVKPVALGDIEQVFTQSGEDGA